MESYITLSFLNDFIFCPRSIYFHGLYQKYASNYYKGEAQVKGQAAHKTIDNQEYSTKKCVLQGIEIYSERYKICGKIDLFDQETGVLTERKRAIKTVYDGYIFQLYAQYYCLQEMGYSVKKLVLHDLVHNKNYVIPIPEKSADWKLKFDTLMTRIKNFKLLAPDFVANQEKCNQCIYANLCDYSLAE